MALSSPFMVAIEQKPGSFGQTMNDIRTWLDHRKIQPSLFKAADSGGGFEIAFAKEDEAHLFKCEFGPLIRQGDPPA